jgi:hypothetical protein
MLKKINFDFSKIFFPPLDIDIYKIHLIFINKVPVESVK